MQSHIIARLVRETATNTDIDSLRAAVLTIIADELDRSATTDTTADEKHVETTEPVETTVDRLVEPHVEETDYVRVETGTDDTTWFEDHVDEYLENAPKGHAPYIRQIKTFQRARSLESLASTELVGRRVLRSTLRQRSTRSRSTYVTPATVAA